MKKQAIFSLIAIACCASIYAYDAITPADNRFLLYDMQFIEAILFIVFTIIFYEIHALAIKNVLLNVSSVVVFFVLLASVKYECDSVFFIVLHGLCYAYFLFAAILVSFRVLTKRS